MFRAMSILIEYPLLAALPSIAFVGLYRVTRRPFVLVLGLAWVLYGIYEYAMQKRVLCSGDGNIRMDLLGIYPVRAVASHSGLSVCGAGLLARFSRTDPRRWRRCWGCRPACARRWRA